ncbi:13831_t:CDS:2 [Racocetra persica]|uniref:13831_t:CDS:1 n=1 Tax=Racocetra persica TaxID=160502 RepID=A0ACA9KNS2_9GLOM|nr:13831_t:CDS:2 [Racocetra persica]
MNLNQTKIYNTDLNNFEYVPEDYEEDTESTSLVVESESIITESVMTDKFDTDIELKPFLFNYTSFDKACELAEEEERENFNILRENHTDANVDSSDLVSSLTFDFEPGLDDESEYLCKHLHKNDTNDGLRILGHWILRMAETADEDHFQ